MNYEYFMSEALLLAKQSLSENEVPVGAVVVKDGEIVGRGRNKRERLKNALSHAEIEAINDACKNLSSWRLDNCDMYVTLEPCPMCAGAILNARIKNVYYAVADEQSGGFSKFNITSSLNHTANVIHDTEFENENKNLIQSFFKEKRKKAR